MRKPRFAQKKDANHNEIAEYLRENSCEVVDCSAIGGIVDLLVYYPPRQFVSFIEVKVPGSRAQFTKEQVRWMAGTRFPVRIVTNKYDALEFARTHEGMLTDSQKYRLRQLADSTVTQKIQPSDVEKAVNV